MAIYRVTITKHVATEYWTNVYHVEASGVTDAASIGEDIAAAERDIHLAMVTFDTVRADDMIPGSDDYAIRTLGYLGLRAMPDDPLALFNTARVEFVVPVGRPSRKYLRGVLREGDVNFNTISPATASLINAYADVVLGLGRATAVDGQSFDYAVTMTDIQMRQLRRGSKRSTTP